MDRKSLHILGIAFFISFSSITAQDSTIFELNETDVEVLYKHYSQDGMQSAVEGGSGSERLKVYGPEFNFKRKFKQNTLNFNFGVDLISSASIDKIDFIRSSASENDGRGFSNISYARTDKNKNIRWGSNIGLSIESDYLSIHGGGLIEYSPRASTKYTGRLDYYYDDLRWGRLDDDHYEPVTLIYPIELRGIRQLPNYLRRSLNLQFGRSEYLTSKDVFGVEALLVRQWGIISTPHHRVYFSDRSADLERLPDSRLKYSMAIRWHRKWSESFLTQSGVTAYVDNFGIQALGIRNKVIIRPNEKWAFMPNFRLYVQSASDYYEAREVHEKQSDFYTSDFDLSAFQSLDLGAEIRYRPFQVVMKKYFIDEFILGYSFYSRERGLRAHYLSLSMLFHYENKK